MDVQRESLVRKMNDFGFRVFPSKSNNLFLRIPEDFSRDRFFKMIEDSEISVVRGSNFPGFNDNFFRLSPRDFKTNQQFVGKLSQIMKKMKENSIN